MPASRKRQSRSRPAKEESDPLPADDPASRLTRMEYHQFLTTHPDVVEELLMTLQAYLRDLAVSETLLVRLGTAQSAEAREACTRRLAANVQARTVELATLQTLLSFLTNQWATSEEEPPVSVH